ncbi:glutathione S-transferase T3-like [Arachis stenosperma]|uniref:glutathione S-transferase T3-like n=1 Tax=Arachis stenosperma TaxID=217475 RepID=UPI0025AC7F8E|nr:glutathione S-transferase T3-like [Arachis stenosperma]
MGTGTVGAKWSGILAQGSMGQSSSEQRPRATNNNLSFGNASRHNSSGVGSSSNPFSQTPIQSSPNSQYSDFANPRGLDAIDLNDDDIEDRRQDSIQQWHWKEDEMLISGWLNVSTDPVVGTDQKGETFWSRIHSYCVEFCTDMTREVVASSRNIRSGSNADDIKELAYKLYSTNYGQKFTFERHWNMLRLEQKWRSQLPTQSGGSKRTKVSATGAYSSSSNPETPLADEPDVDSPARPQGSKKSKRRGKGKAQMSEDFSERKSSVVKKLSLMEDIKNVREKELMEREKEREEEKEHRARMMAIKEKELQIQAAMKEQELQTQRYIKEMEIKAKERKMDM